ncbi:hypothetical protein NDU88_004211 [Pleurodeles waltl]|uniref:Uncharacterized protein n=1 Tax=Pleurodeles waltl TaxID=8319 RepID=A0AAV7NIX6_PLEWA|nr:hypothetical protein NDU88_004211 [Pleurodeles waltl]
MARTLCWGAVREPRGGYALGPLRACGEQGICAYTGVELYRPAGDLQLLKRTPETRASGRRLEVGRSLAGLLVLSLGGDLVPPDKRARPFSVILGI